MASIYESLNTYLTGYAGLAALISTRYYPDELPQGCTLPAVVYLTVSDVKNHVYGAQDTLEEPMVQFTVYASTKLSAQAVAEQIKAALCEYTGTLSGIVVQYIGLINELPGSTKISPESAKINTHDLEFAIYFNKE